jgi:hypothetical protein
VALLKWLVSDQFAETASVKDKWGSVRTCLGSDDHEDRDFMISRHEAMVQLAFKPCHRARDQHCARRP